MAKTTWDVWVVLANDPSQTIAYVPRWKSIQFSDQLNDVGSATLEHDFSDPFFAAFQVDRGDSLLEGPYALQIRRDGSPVFTFFIEDVQVDRAGTSQPLTIGGRGIGCALEWGIVLPEDFSNQARATAGTTQRPKFFDRLFPGYAYNVRVATTANLSANYAIGPQSDQAGAGARLTATSNGSINNSGIDGVTDLVVGDNVLVKNQSNAAHNGIYWIVTVGGASTPWVVQRTARADGSPISDLEVGNAAFVNEGTVNGYTSWSIASNGGLSQSNQVGSVSIVWTQVSVGSFTGISAFYILFKEADTGYEYSTKKDTFGTVKTLYGRGGTGYAVDWPLALDNTLNTSLGKTDSKGRVVRDGGNFNIAVGRTVLDVLNEVSSNTGVDWHVGPTGVISIAVRPFVTDTVVFSVPFGSDKTSGSAALLFSLPMLENVETRTSVTDLRTVVYGSDGFNLDRQISDRTGTYGFRELFIENSGDDAPAVANITASAVRQVRDGKLQITTSFAERDGMTAWNDFDIGDKVLVEIDTGTFSERIISAIGASVDENGGETIEVTFGDVFQDIASNLKYAANYGRLGAAEIPTFTLRGTSSKPSKATGTSVGAEVQGLSNRVVVNWESPDNSSAAQYEAIVYREQQNSVGVTIAYPITNIYRDGNIAYCTVSASHGFSDGDWVNIYDTTDDYFDRITVFLTSASGASFTFDDVGPDIPSGTYTSGDVVRVVERHSTVVPSNRTSAGFENLGAPGREYNFTILPFTSNGQAGIPSDPFPFTASASAQIVLNGAIRSNNYVTNTSGWTIEADGNAELNQVTIRNGAWVQGTLTAPTLQTATTNPRIIVNSSGLYAYNNAGDIVTSVSASTGALFSSSASISGNITGGTIDIGGNDATSFHVDADGNIWLGAATFASAPFRVTSAGALTVTSATITGYVASGGAAADVNNNATEINGGKISANTINANRITTGTLSASQISTGTLSANFISGGTISASEFNINSGTFRVFSDGSMVATSANVTGTVTTSNLTATGGSIGGWTVNGSSDLRNGSGTTILRANGTIDIGGDLNSSGVVSAASRVTTSGYMEAANYFQGNSYATAFYAPNGTISAGNEVVAGSVVRGTYFVGSGTVQDSGTDVVRRNDGYYLKKTSLREYKEDILSVTGALDLIDALTPRTFKWKPRETDPDNIHTTQIKRVYKNYGFIVEEVQEVSNELVHWDFFDTEDGQLLKPSMWKTDDFIAIGIQGIKELKVQIEALETRLSLLESAT